MRNEHPSQYASTGSARLGRGVAAAFGTLVLAVSGLVVVSSPAEATAPAPQQVRIKKTEKADGGFLGSRRAGADVGYRINPSAKPGGKRFKKVRAMPRVKGASTRATARAAWIISEYGSYPDPKVAAGVDVAVLSLLRGGKWALDSGYTRRRTDQSGDGALIRKNAEALVRASRQHAGPYRLSVRVIPDLPGTRAEVEVKVVSATGSSSPVYSEVPITLSYAGQKVTETGTIGEPISVDIDAVPGNSKVTVSARVPEHRLFVRASRSKKRSGVAITGRKRTISGTFAGPTNGNLSARFRAEGVRAYVGHSMPGRIELWGGRGTRTVKSALYGPSTNAAMGCTGTPVWSGTQVTTADRLDLPTTWKTQKTGYYWWKITVRDATGSITRCGPRSNAVIWLRYDNESQNDMSPLINQQFGPTLTITGFDRPASVPVTTTFYGPVATYEEASNCAGPIKATSTRTITGNTTIAPRTSHPNSGYFSLRVQIPDTPFYDGFTGPCRRFAVHRPLQVAVSAGSAATVKVGKAFGPTMKVSGFDRRESHTVTTTLHGPFEKKEYATCQYIAKKTVKRTITTNDTSSPRFSIGSKANVGWYVIKSEVSGTSLLTGNKACTGAYRVVLG